MKAHLIRCAAVATGVLLMTAAYDRTQTASGMTETARRFLAALTPEQRAKASFEMTADERQNWHFTPTPPRKGLPLREMSPYQKHLASALIASGLSQQGYIKAVSIMSMEDVLRILEKDDGERRNPEKYYLWIFGTPSDTAPWGYRVEGHHVSQNYTVVNGRALDAPSFFGSNPAEVKEGPRAGLRILAGEEDLGRDLLNSLDAAQRKVATVDGTAYKDILTSDHRKVALEGQPSGLSASKMTGTQFAKLTALLDEYVNNVPGQMAAQRRELIQKAGRNVFFAWAGVGEKGGPHYYRVQAPTFLVEYDCTQNDNNHIHAVWREMGNDFGLDLLQAHYQSSHR